MSHTNYDLAAALHQRGHKLTPQRQIILDALCEMGGHVTVAELYERVHSRFPAIDRSTVYRALDFFGELGLVGAAEVGGAAVYEMAGAEGANGRPHHHLVCRDCGAIEHAPGDAFSDLAARLRADFGFAADVDNLTIRGICRECNPAAEA
jgi:Fe2+ or Zn2+ uptake regulation protein